jgi:hypothetical protein
VTFALLGTLTLSDWTSSMGAQSLQTGVLYYLEGGAPGRITSSAPTDAGSVVQLVGLAIASQTILLQVQPAIQL